MNDNFIEAKKLSMFYPKTKKGLIVDYPELEKIDAFRKLNKFDLLFVWYYACKSSPFASEEDSKIRTEKSVIEAFGEKKADQIMGKFMAGNLPETIRNAVAEMEKFQIGPRVKAKMMIEKIMDNFETLIDIDVTVEFKGKDDADGEDWTKKKAYIDSCAKISSTLPKLISQSEGSFGITEKEDGEVVDVESEDLIDEFHNQE